MWWLLATALAGPVEPAFPSATLGPVATGMEARFPLKSRPPVGTTVTAGGARRNDDGAILGPVDARLEMDPVPTLVLHAPTNLRGGTYDVGVLASGSGEAAVLNLSVERPSPRLELSPSMLRLQAEWPQRQPPELVLFLRESSGLAGPGTLSATWTGGTDEAGTLSRGTLSCRFQQGSRSAESMALGPSETAMLRCTPAGFERGLVNGMLRLAGTELSAPMDVAVQIQTQVASWCIPLLILAGIVASNLVRMVLDRQVERGEALLEGEQLRQQLERMYRDAQDRLFRADLEQQRLDLAGSLGNTALEPAELRTALKRVSLAMTDAVDRFQKTQQEAKEKLENLEPALSPRWNLPTEVAADFRSAVQAGEEARRQLSLGMPSAAAKTLVILDQRLESLVDASRTWARETDRLFLSDEQRPPQLTPIYEKLKPALARLQEAEAGEIRGRLKDLHDLNEVLERSLKPAVEALSEEIQASLAEIRKNTAPALAPLSAELARAAALPRREPRDFLAQDLRWTLEMMGKAATAMMDTLDPGPIQTLMAAGQYRKLASYLRTGAGTAGGTTAPETPRTVASLSSPAAPPVTETAALALPRLNAPVPPQELRVREALARARFWRQAAIALLTAVLGWSLLDDDWTGTMKDLIGAVAWGLTVPLSTEALFGLATRLVPAPLKE